jgi:hypothetical protein
MATYQGKQVTKLSRPAHEGDKGFKQGTEQVVIKGEDGQEQAVPKDQVKD